MGILSLILMAMVGISAQARDEPEDFRAALLDFSGRTRNCEMNLYEVGVTNHYPVTSISLIDGSNLGQFHLWFELGNSNGSAATYYFPVDFDHGAVLTIEDEGEERMYRYRTTRGWSQGFTLRITSSGYSSLFVTNADGAVHMSCN